MKKLLGKKNVQCGLKFDALSIEIGKKFCSGIFEESWIYLQKKYVVLDPKHVIVSFSAQISEIYNFILNEGKHSISQKCPYTG